MSNATVAAVKIGLNAALDLVFPPRCILCDRFGPDCLCAACASKMPVALPEPTCPRCGHPRESLPCGECLSDPPSFVSAVAAGAYKGGLQDAIHWLKYRDKPQLAEPLGRMLAEFAQRERALLGGLAFDAIIPVPLHPARLRVRGYNHAERLARVVGREVGLPVRADLLRRVRKTHPQVGLDGDARRKNLAGAFRASDDAAGLALLLLDDVSTTGATQREAAKTLKESGAEAVYCLTLAAG